MEAELTSRFYHDPVAPAPRTVALSSVADSAAPAVPELHRRIGLADGDPRYTFGEVADLTLSAGGDTLYVLDSLERSVVAYDAEGRFVGRFGRRGRGPGEYEDPRHVLLLPWSGDLAVWDAALQRLTVLSPAGEVLRTTSLDPNTDASPLLLPLSRPTRRLRAHPSGFLLERRTDPLRTPPGEQHGVLVRLDTAAVVQDTLLTFPVPPVVGQHREGEGGQWTAFDAPPFFLPDPKWDAGPRGEIVYVPGGPYLVHRLGADGEPVMTLRREWLHAPVTRRDRVQLIRTAQEETGGSLVPAAVLERTMRDRFAAVRPALHGALIDERGRAWVRRFDTRDDAYGRGRTWDVYGAHGSLVGTVRFPPDYEPLLLRAKRIFGVETTREGASRIAVYVNPFD